MHLLHEEMDLRGWQIRVKYHVCFALVIFASNSYLMFELYLQGRQGHKNTNFASFLRIL